MRGYQEHTCCADTSINNLNFTAWLQQCVGISIATVFRIRSLLFKRDPSKYCS